MSVPGKQLTPGKRDANMVLFSEMLQDFNAHQEDYQDDIHLSDWQWKKLLLGGFSPEEIRELYSKDPRLNSSPRWQEWFAESTALEQMDKHNSAIAHAQRKKYYPTVNGRYMGVGRMMGINVSKRDPVRFYQEATKRTKGIAIKDVANFYYDYGLPLEQVVKLNSAKAAAVKMRFEQKNRMERVPSMAPNPQDLLLNASLPTSSASQTSMGSPGLGSSQNAGGTGGGTTPSGGSGARSSGNASRSRSMPPESAGNVVEASDPVRQNLSQQLDQMLAPRTSDRTPMQLS